MSARTETLREALARVSGLRAALEGINATHGTGAVTRITRTHYLTQRQYGCGRYRYHVRDGRVFARGTSRVMVTV